ncbi:uncharacterized protein LOC123315427 [Coccinella septempunctata]|uniref:uncharacterized protein LOC123315427 n=1 Tax=Coccinella septempunctata TaxID=41139 RepID=UPI001D081439|nr:uncharacterized protein LOC123315427 [Coccinella septempunctata]XP_044757052.1 uncharacterized protein LOC123315427 [Coccinella septempunctata]
MILSYFLRKLNDILNINKDDPLRFVEMTTMDLGKFTLLKALLYAGLSYNILFFLIQIAYFAVNFELKQFIQFFSLNVGALHGYLASWTVLRYEKDSIEMINYKQKHFIKLSQISASSYTRILKSVTPRRYFFLLNLLAMHFLFLFFWPIFGYEDDYYFPVYFLNEYVRPLFGRYIAFSLRIFFYITTYTYVTSAWIQVHISTYFLSQMEFQLIVVEDYIRDLGKLPISEERIHSSVVDEHLKVCIRHYFHVLEFMDKMKGWIFWPMMAATVGSLVMLLSYIYFILVQASLEAFPRVVSLFLSVAFSIVLYSMCGQGLVDQCGRVNSALYFLPWYKYSKKNCELLRLFMVTTSKPLFLNLLGFLEVDALLVMQVYKFVVSSLAAVQQIVALRKRDD